MVWSLTSYGKNFVVLGQRLMPSLGSLLLHSQLCLCLSLYPGKFLVQLNFCHCPWPCHRFNWKLSLGCLLLQCPKVSTWHAHGNVLSPSWLLLHGCCLHNPSAFSAVTTSWCLVEATSRDPALVVSNTLLLLAVVLRAIQSLQVFCKGKKKHLS